MNTHGDDNVSKGGLNFQSSSRIVKELNLLNAREAELLGDFPDSF